MTDWRDSVLAFSALPQVAPLLLSSDPAWIWSRDARLLWANPAGGARLDLARLAEWNSHADVVVRTLGREVESLLRSAPDKGTLARLRLSPDLHALPVTCRCRRVRAGEERGLLAVSVEGSSFEPALSDLLAFFSSKDTTAALFDAAGNALAGEQADRAEPPAGESYVELQEAGHNRRLYLLRRQLPTGSSEAEEVDTDAAVPPPASNLVDPSEAQPNVHLPSPGHSDEVSAPPGKRKLTEPPREAPSEAPRGARISVVASRRAPPAPAVVRPAASAGVATSKGGQHSAALPRPPTLDAADSPDVPQSRPLAAGRVARELSRKPVRFLWQTDGADRFLFVSPGLSQVVGRNAEIVGERWQDAAARLRLDPTLRIARAVAQRDTWSGQTAWWPIEGSNVRVPAELTALPIFGPDHSFQGYRGFGVLRPAEALMPAAFEARFGTANQAFDKVAEQLPPYEEAIATTPPSAGPANVVPIRADLDRSADQARLTAQERSAFDEIAAALRERVIEAPAGSGAREDAPVPPDVPEAADAVAARPMSNAVTAGRQEAVKADAPVILAEAELADKNKASAAASAEQASVPAREQEPPKPSIPEPKAAEAQEPSRPSKAIDVELAKSASDTAEAARAVPKLHAPENSAQRRVRELTAILDTATDGVLILDAEGTIASANAGAEALFGLEAHELQGTDFGELLTPESRQAAVDYLSGLTDNGVASLLNEGREIEAQAGPGSIPLFMTMGRISGEDGGRFCAVLRDITHWKRTEAELVAAKRAAEEASAQKSEFIARVSHEIRTPLNAIIGFTEVMIEERFGGIENERYREYVRDIRTSGEHVVSLINDLLDISKIEAGKLDLDFAAVPLNDLVRECIGLMQPQANRARVVLRSSLSRDVPAIVADGRTLRQIVLNLLSNSVKFTGPGGQVIASTSLLESGEALLRVRDTGEGMSEEELARALEPFRQIATATLSDRTGSGLGLPLTKALVEANRASLTIRSARGEGTVVTVTFPPTRVLSE